MCCINFRSRWCTSQVKLSMLMKEAWHYFVPFPKSHLYRHNTHMEYTYHYHRLTCPCSQTKRTPPFDKHALWRDRTGYGLAWEPHPLPPPASFLRCGEFLSLPASLVPLHPNPCRTEMWGLPYSTPFQMCHANWSLQLAEKHTNTQAQTNTHKE